MPHRPDKTKEGASPQGTKGVLVILSAPSGTGKSTICRKLLGRRKDLRYSISCTTRDPRPGERNGKHYTFLTPEEFREKVRRRDFLEWAVVHDNLYGTPKRYIETTTRKGRSVLLAIDVQGAAAIKRMKPDSVLVFVLPPSIKELRERLAARKDETESAAKRLVNARKELAAAKDFDYIVINDDLNRAVSQIESILISERLKTSRQKERTLIPLTA